MFHNCQSRLDQVRHAGLLVCQLFQSFVDARLAECIDLQAFHNFVFAIGAGDGKTEHDVFGNSVPAL